jgi:hypothetical protein
MDRRPSLARDESPRRPGRRINATCWGTEMIGFRPCAARRRDPDAFARLSERVARFLGTGRYLALQTLIFGPTDESVGWMIFLLSSSACLRGEAGQGVGVKDRPVGSTVERPEVLDPDAARPILV